MRRKTRNSLILLVLILLVAAPLLVKGLIYLRVRQVMDKLIEESVDKAEIHYRGIDTELRGAASVLDLSVRPLAFKQPIEIEQVRVQTDDPWILLTGGGNNDQLPPHLRIDIRSIHVPLGEQLQKMFQSSHTNATPSTPAPCAAFNLGPSLLKVMGYQGLDMDMGMDYRFNESDESVDMAFDFNMDGIQSLNMSMRLSDLTRDDVMDRRLSGVQFAQADVDMNLEPEFGKRYVAYCAKQRGMAPEVFVESLIQNQREQLSKAGVILGGGLQAALETLYHDWGELRLHVQPEQPMGMGQLIALRPESLVQTLGISLSINGKYVNDLYIKLDMEKLAEQSRRPPSDIRPDSLATAPKRIRVIRKFHLAPVSSLGQHLGEQVRIHPRNAPVREGELIAISNGEAQVKQRAHGGSVTSYVPLKDIAALEVERVERKPLR